MPVITQWFIKAGMIWFCLGTAVALLAEFPSAGGAALLLPVYWHMLVMGWITQVIMGVAVWMFPRTKRDRKKEYSGAVTGAFFLLNTGLIIRFLCEPFLPVFTETAIIRVMVIASAVFQVAAAGLFISEIWPRVQPKKLRKYKDGSV